MSILTSLELKKIGFKKIGKHVFISSKASFYNPQAISIGDHVRIDDFCVLSAGIGEIEIGNFIHIGVYSSLIGQGKIVLEDFVNISTRVSVFSSTDDFSGEFMTNPMVDSQFTGVISKPVTLRKHVLVGSGSTILPGTILEEGVSIGAMSLVKNNCKSFTIYAGIPVKQIKPRLKNIIELEKNFLSFYYKK